MVSMLNGEKKQGSCVSSICNKTAEFSKWSVCHPSGCLLMPCLSFPCSEMGVMTLSCKTRGSIHQCSLVESLQAPCNALEKQALKQEEKLCITVAVSIASLRVEKNKSENGNNYSAQHTQNVYLRGKSAGGKVSALRGCIQHKAARNGVWARAIRYFADAQPLLISFLGPA